MTTIRSFRDLVVWQRAMDLAVEAYSLTALLPKSEIYGLTAQITRAAASVPANIAEGHARSTRKDYANFLSIGQGSLAETHTFILLAIRLGYLPEERAQGALSLIDETGRLLSGLQRRLRQSATPEP